MDNERQKLEVEKNSFEEQKEYFFNEARKKADKEVKAAHKEEIVELEAKLHAANQELNNQKPAFQYNTLDEVTSDYDNNNPILLTIGTDWCGYSTQLQDRFSNIQEELKSNGLPSFYYLNGDDKTHSDFVNNNFNVQGYPTIILMQKDRKPIEYAGARDSNHIKVFINENLPKLEAIIKEPEKPE